MTSVDFAILAPVPREHIESGEAISTTSGYVCFGSDKWQTFQEVEARRDGQNVPVLLYASHNEDLAEWGYVVAWSGHYIGSVDTVEGMKREENAGHRPPTTLKYKESGNWGLFWKVADLRPLPINEHRELRDLQSYRTGKDRHKHAPRGPELIVRPSWL